MHNFANSCCNGYFVLFFVYYICFILLIYTLYGERESDKLNITVLRKTYKNATIINTFFLIRLYSLQIEYFKIIFLIFHKIFQTMSQKNTKHFTKLSLALNKTKEK